MNKIIIERIEENLYLLTPMICIVLWALFNSLHAGFIPTKPDFYVYYESGKYLYTKPADLYEPGSRYYYMPVLATFCAITISFLPYFLAYYIFYLANIILGIIFVREYNKILVLKDIKEKWHRFIFLMVISNGMIIYSIFYQNSFKFLIGLVLIFVIRREIQYRKQERERNYKFYLINYGLFTFIVGLFPPLIFFLLLYALNNIQITDILKKENIKKYAIILVMFTSQNVLFLIYPSLIFDFLRGYEGHNQRGYLPLFYLREWIVLDNYNFIYCISTVYMLVVLMVLFINNQFQIEEKFAYCSFAWIIFSVYGGRSLLFLFPFALLLYIPFLEKNNAYIEFFKKNKIILIGLISVIGIYFMIPDFTILKYIPVFKEFPYIIFLYLRWLILLCIFCGSVIILYSKKFINNR